MKRFGYTLLGVAIFGFTLTQCNKKDTVVGWQPTYAMPLLDAEMSIGEVVGAQPNEVATEYAFGAGTDSTFFFKLIYTDTLDPLMLLQFQNTNGTYDQPVSIPLGEQSMYLRMLGKSKEGEFQFTNPEVQFQFNNYTNMEYELSFDTLYTLNVQNQNKYYFQLKDPTIDIAAGGPQGNISHYNVTNDSTNPTGALSVVFEPTPKYLYYYPVITSKGGTNIEGDRVEVYAKVILPFEGRGRASHRDTIPYEFDPTLIEDVLDFAFLRLNFTNGIPLEAKMTGIIVDTTDYREIARLPLYDPETNDTNKNSVVVPAATQNDLNPDANPTTIAAQKTSDIRVYRNNPVTGEDDLQNIVEGNAVIIKLEFNTSGFEDDENVKIYSSQKLLLNMGLKTRVNASVNLDSLQDSILNNN